VKTNFVSPHYFNKDKVNCKSRVIDIGK